VQRNSFEMVWHCGHVTSKDENDRLKKCIDYEMEGVRARGKPKKN